MRLNLIVGRNLINVVMTCITLQYIYSNAVETTCMQPRDLKNVTKFLYESVLTTVQLSKVSQRSESALTEALKWSWASVLLKNTSAGVKINSGSLVYAVMLAQCSNTHVTTNNHLHFSLLPFYLTLRLSPSQCDPVPAETSCVRPIC